MWVGSLTKLSISWVNLESVPAEMPYCFIQLQRLSLWDFGSLEYLPRSFTRPGAFPALIKFELSLLGLVEFPEVDEGALPKLQRLDFSGCSSLGSLPVSLEVLTSLRELILFNCGETVEDSCRTNCEESSIWRRFDIRSDWDSDTEILIDP